MSKEALVVRRDILFKKRYFTGFSNKDEFDYHSIILNNYFYAKRDDKLEHDRLLQQIIPYIIIINKEEKKIFAYRRAPDERYSEKRLRNKWSIGVGGHIEKQDDENPIERGMMREFKEEVIINNYPTPELFGYINSEQGVEEVHFALVYLANVKTDIKIGDGEIDACSFYSISEFEEIFKNTENLQEEWTKIAWPHVKEYLLT